MVEKIQALLVKRGLKQTAFEPMAGLPANRISKWAGGQGEPTARQALRMAKLLDVNLEYLIDDELDEEPGHPMSKNELKVWEIVQEIGPEEAWRRLLRPTNHPPRVAADDLAIDENRSNHLGG